MKQCTIYPCSKCEKPYFGGMMDCAERMNAEAALDPNSLICKECVVEEMGYGKEICNKHGNRYIDWKCQLCCSIAVWTCGGKYFCTPCHNNYMAKKIRDEDITRCMGGKDCPLGLE